MSLLKKSIAIATAFLFCSFINDNCAGYFLSQEGVVLTYKEENSKGKIESYRESSVVEMSGGNIFKLNMKQFDNKKKPTGDFEFEVECTPNGIKIDMMTFVDQEMLAAYENMTVDITSDDLTLPSNMNIGDQLEEGEVTITVSTEGMQVMKINTRLTNRQVLSTGKYTVEAGIYDAVCVSSTISTSMGFMNKSYTTKQWFAKDIGELKTETYTEKGKLISTSELISVK